jgi:GNAT superfamily N-acetyltransferase
MKSHVTIALLADTPRNHARVQRVLDGAPTYAMRTEGRLAEADEGAAVFTSLAPGGSIAQKSVFVIQENGDDVGVIDIYRGWNTPEKIMIGLLLLIEPAHRRGIGTRAYAVLRDLLLAESGDYCILRIGIIQTNLDAFPFWCSLGFVETGEIKHSDAFIAPVVIFERTLP